MQGDLGGTNVAELLLALHKSTRTGILRLAQGEVKKGIYFKDGQIVFAHSNLKSERLGETLLRLGKITEEEFNIASVDVIEKGKRLGRSLYEKGFLSLAEVNAGVSYQLQQIVYSIFNWEVGEYEFVDRERPVYEDIMVDISTTELLFGGIRHITNPPVLEKLIGKDESLMVSRVEEPAVIHGIDLDFAEEMLLGCLGEKSSIARLRTLSHLAPLEFGRAIFALLFSGIILLRSATAEEKQPAVRKNRRQSFTTRPMQSLSRHLPAKASRRRLKTFSESEMRRLITESEARFHDMTDEEILGVLPDCTREEIEEAYNRQIAIFHPPYYSEGRYRDLKEKLKFISEQLTSAYEHLLEKAASRLPFTSQSLESAPAPTDLQGSLPVETVPVSVPATAADGSNISVPEESKKEEAFTIGQLQEKLRQDSDNADFLRQLAKLMIKEGNAREAERLLQRALELEPQRVDNHFVFAELYQSLGLKMKAFKHLNLVLKLDPKNQRAMELLDIKKRKPLYEISRGT